MNRNYPFDKPSKSDHKNFWSVFETGQQRKKQQLEQQMKGNHGEAKA